MINLKSSKKTIAALTLTTLIMSACSTQIGTSTKIENNTSPNKDQIITTKLTPELQNIENMKASYEAYLQEQERKLQEPASYNVLRPSDFKAGFQTKANGTVNTPGLAGSAVIVTIGTTATQYVLSYRFMRKLRLSLKPNTTAVPNVEPRIQNYLTIADYNRLAAGSTLTSTAGTVTDEAGNTEDWKATASEAAFIGVLKTFDAVIMPNFLQGFTAGGEATDGNNAYLAVNPGQEPEEWGICPETLEFISNAKSPAIRPPFYEEIHDAASDGVLTASESTAIKGVKLPLKFGATAPAQQTLPNATELAFLNGINSQVTAWGVVLIDDDGPPVFDSSGNPISGMEPPMVQKPIDIEVGYGNNQSPGGFNFSAQTALNIVQNTGMVNRNVDSVNDNPDLTVQQDILTPEKHQAGTNYAPGAVVVAAQLLLQGVTGTVSNNNTPGSIDYFTDTYESFVSSPSLGCPITFNNFHSIMRKMQEDYMDAPPAVGATAAVVTAYNKKSVGGIKFNYSGAGTTQSPYVLKTDVGLGAALASGWYPWTQTLIPKVGAAATQNKTGITEFLANTQLIPNVGGQSKAIVVECTRAATGALTFTSATTTNHAILVKYEVVSGVANVLFVYDPGMPNNPGAPGAVSNYRPMTDAEKNALYASPVKLVGIKAPVI